MGHFLLLLSPQLVGWGHSAFPSEPRSVVRSGGGMVHPAWPVDGWVEVFAVFWGDLRKFLQENGYGGHSITRQGTRKHIPHGKAVKSSTQVRDGDCRGIWESSRRAPILHPFWGNQYKCMVFLRDFPCNFVIFRALFFFVGWELSF